VVTSKAQFKFIVIFTDGACSGNPGPGGWGSVIATPEGEIRELGGGKDQTTNNEMELMAALRALEKLKDDIRPVTLFTDSVYVIRGITQWVWGWRNRGWTTAEGEPVKNKSVWEQLVRVTTARGPEGKVEWLYSRGHVGTPGNERCDEIAVAFSKGQRPRLYAGSLLNYDIAIYDFPEDTSLPEMTAKQEKKKAFSYLSKIGTVVCRHKEWASCERRVKGQSGALFKKAMSESDELEILKAWGLPAKTAIQDIG
jgi:ribonuclease HI